jgi:hypothetical protein
MVATPLARLPARPRSVLATRSVGRAVVILDDDPACASTAAIHAYVVLGALRSRAVPQIRPASQPSGDRARSVDEQHLARDVCARGRSKQDRRANDLIRLR